MAAVDDNLAQLSDSRVFSKLGANSGFWQIRLSRKSGLLTTFLTSFGRYCFDRLPFGISSASEIFQKAMMKVTDNIKRVLRHADDILINGNVSKKQDDSLLQVLARPQQYGPTLNGEKCEFKEASIRYLGHIIDQRGIRADPLKTSAILGLPEPSNRSDLRRINGTINPMANCIPRLAAATLPMPTLLRERHGWVWGSPQLQAFEQMKQLLASSKVLAVYSPYRETIRACDASDSFLGAAFIQT